MARSHCEVQEGEDAATKCLAEVVEEAITPVMKKPTLAESVSEHVCNSGVPDVVVTNTATGHNTPNTAVTATTDDPAAGTATGPMETETSVVACDLSAAAAISPMAAAVATCRCDLCSRRIQGRIQE
jgi:predicted TIM-barrel enzyme